MPLPIRLIEMPAPPVRPAPPEDIDVDATAGITPLTITAVADGLAYVRGRIVPGGPGRRWEYLETHHSRESALDAARAEGGPLRLEAETLSSDRTDGIAPTRPPADS